MLNGLDKFSKNMAYCSYGGEFFRYNAAAFGLPKIPGVYQLVNSVAVNILRKWGFHVFLYLDDRLFLTRPKNKEEEEALLSGKLIPKGPLLGMMLMTALGTCLNRPKCELIPTRRIEFLGFILDTNLCTIEIPTGKWEKFCEEARKILESKKVKTKDLEKLRGKMASFTLVALNMRLYIRRITHAITVAKKDEWISLNQDIRDEIKTWIEAKFIAKKRKWLKDGVIPMTTKVYTDASNFAGGVKINSEDIEINIPWGEQDAIARDPIHIKEAYAVYYVLKNYGKKFRNRRLHFLNDNMAVVKTFEFECQNPALTRLIRMIHEEAVKYNILLDKDWVSTLDQEADAASRTVDVKEAIFRKEKFEEIEKNLGIKFTLDFMATSTNTKCEKYISLREENDAWKTNFFTVKNFGENILWAYPPKGCTDKTFNYLVSYAKKNTWVLVVVEYESASPIRVQAKECNLEIKDLVFKDQILFPAKKSCKKWDYWKVPQRLSVFLVINKCSLKRKIPNVKDSTNTTME